MIRSTRRLSLARPGPGASRRESMTFTMARQKEKQEGLAWKARLSYEAELYLKEQWTSAERMVGFIHASEEWRNAKRSWREDHASAWSSAVAATTAELVGDARGQRAAAEAGCEVQPFAHEQHALWGTWRMFVEESLAEADFDIEEISDYLAMPAALAQLEDVNHISAARLRRQARVASSASAILAENADTMGRHGGGGGTDKTGHLSLASVLLEALASYVSFVSFAATMDAAVSRSRSPKSAAKLSHLPATASIAMNPPQLNSNIESVRPIEEKLTLIHRVSQKLLSLQKFLSFRDDAPGSLAASTGGFIAALNTGKVAQLEPPAAAASIEEKEKSIFIQEKELLKKRISGIHSLRLKELRMVGENIAWWRRFQLQIGQHVSHEAHGDGVIEAINVSSDLKVHIKFQGNRFTGPLRQSFERGEWSHIVVAVSPELLQKKTRARRATRRISAEAEAAGLRVGQWWQEGGLNVSSGDRVVTAKYGTERIGTVIGFYDAVPGGASGSNAGENTFPMPSTSKSVVIRFDRALKAHRIKKSKWRSDGFAVISPATEAAAELARVAKEEERVRLEAAVVAQEEAKFARQEAAYLASKTENANSFPERIHRTTRQLSRHFTVQASIRDPNATAKTNSLRTRLSLKVGDALNLIRRGSRVSPTSRSNPAPSLELLRAVGEAAERDAGNGDGSGDDGDAVQTKGTWYSRTSTETPSAVDTAGAARARAEARKMRRAVEPGDTSAHKRRLSIAAEGLELLRVAREESLLIREVHRESKKTHAELIIEAKKEYLQARGGDTREEEDDDEADDHETVPLDPSNDSVTVVSSPTSAVVTAAAAADPAATATAETTEPSSKQSQHPLQRNGNRNETRRRSIGGLFNRPSRRSSIGNLVRKGIASLSKRRNSTGSALYTLLRRRRRNSSSSSDIFLQNLHAEREATRVAAEKRVSQMVDDHADAAFELEGSCDFEVPLDSPRVSSDERGSKMVGGTADKQAAKVTTQPKSFECPLHVAQCSQATLRPTEYGDNIIVADPDGMHSAMVQTEQTSLADGRQGRRKSRENQLVRQPAKSDLFSNMTSSASSAEFAACPSIQQSATVLESHSDIQTWNRPHTANGRLLFNSINPALSERGQRPATVQTARFIAAARALVPTEEELPRVSLAATPRGETISVRRKSRTSRARDVVASKGTRAERIKARGEAAAARIVAKQKRAAAQRAEEARLAEEAAAKLQSQIESIRINTAKLAALREKKRRMKGGFLNPGGSAPGGKAGDHEIRLYYGLDAPNVGDLRLSY